MASETQAVGLFQPPSSHAYYRASIIDIDVADPVANARLARRLLDPNGENIELSRWLLAFSAARVREKHGLPLTFTHHDAPTGAEEDLMPRTNPYDRRATPRTGGIADGGLNVGYAEAKVRAPTVEGAVADMDHPGLTLEDLTGLVETKVSRARDDATEVERQRGDERAAAAQRVAWDEGYTQAEADVAYDYWKVAERAVTNRMNAIRAEVSIALGNLTQDPRKVTKDDLAGLLKGIVDESDNIAGIFDTELAPAPFLAQRHAAG